MERKIKLTVELTTNSEPEYESFVTLLWAYVPQYLEQMKKQAKDMDYSLSIDWVPEMNDKVKSEKVFELLKHHFEHYVTTMTQLGHVKEAYKYLDDIVDDLWVKKPLRENK